MTELELIHFYYNQNKTNYLKAIQRDIPLFHWIYDQTQPYQDLSLKERIAVLLLDQNPICPRGQTKKYKSFEDGFGFCGNAGVCECARLDRSEKVKATKSIKTFAEDDVTIGFDYNSDQNFIDELINKFGTQNLSQQVKKHKSISERIDAYCQQWTIEKFSEKVYLYYTQSTPICENGKQKTFAFWGKYRYCGRKCACQK